MEEGRLRDLLRTMTTHQLRLDKVITELWWYVRANSRQLGDSHVGTRITILGGGGEVVGRLEGGGH